MGEISPGGEAVAAGDELLEDVCGDVVVDVAEDGVFLGGEVVEERAAGDVGTLADFLHGVAVEARVRRSVPVRRR